MKKLLLALLLIVLASTAFSQTYTKRLALVIGNSNYPKAQLKNPVNDARAMAAELKILGFEVITVENASLNQIKQAINSFGQKLRAYEVGLFYYSGHGIQHKGANYLIPVEAELQSAEQIEFDCVSADRVLAYMEAASTKLNVIIMDACRNNPFERSWSRSADGSGLAMMNAPTGTLIAYATAPGKVASDGQVDHKNGLYTEALLKYMRDPSLNIEQVFKKVRTEVSEKSYGSQVPWETTSLTGNDFYFPTTKNTAPVYTQQSETNYTGGNTGSQSARGNTTSTAIPQGWHLFTNTKQGYKLAFPKKPIEQTQVIPSALGDLTMDMAMVDASDGSDVNALYMVNHTLFPADKVNSANTEMLPTLYRSSIDGAAANVNGTLTSEKIVVLDNKYEGREVTIDYDGGAYVITMRIYLVHNIMYLTQVFTAADKIGNKSLTDFMDSFHLINP